MIPARPSARPVEATPAKELLDEFTVQECTNYLVNSGYGST
jgi:hypothetical protein